MQTARRPGQVFSRIVVPLVLFLIIIGAVAYVLQNVQIWRPRATKDEPVGQNMLSFDYQNSLWNPEVPEYLKEVEPGEKGSYDFPFANGTKSELEVGLDHANCTCTWVKIALIPDGASESQVEWIDLKHPDGKSENQAIAVPVGGKGKVRVGWGREAEKDSINWGPKGHSATIWVQLKGQGQSKRTTDLKVAVRIVPKLHFTVEDKVDLGTFTDRVSNDQSPLICWSATRDIRKTLTIDKNRVERGFHFKITPLTDAELKSFQKEFLDEAKPRIQSKALAAAKINIEVVADQLAFDGPFAAVRIPLVLEGQSYTLGPSVYGGVEASVAIEGCPLGTIPLLTSKDFTIRKIPEQTMLTIVHSPPIIQVSLEPFNDEGKRRWKLKVVRPPNTGLSDLDNAIVIRSQPMEYYRADALSLVSALGKIGAMTCSAEMA